ncbi:MAG: dinitrogenase iron-molybdenum cofactor biosynthesis protein [Clostridiales bacterium]|nr:dinitrogenase iron-molybdenum cofactor biosynthesis protein [Clostridiales bacterium]
MRVLIPVDEDNSLICPTFGRTPYFLLFDTENKEKEILGNPAAQAQGGAGLQAAQFVLDNKVDIIITPRCGQNAADVFREAEIKIYKSEGQSAEVNIENFVKGTLSLLEHFHSGYHGIK